MDNTVISFRFPRAKNMGRIESWIRKRRELPAATNNARGKVLEEGAVIVGNQYITNDGHLVTVLRNDLVFMGFSPLVEYSNGAIRRPPSNASLFEVA